MPDRHALIVLGSLLLFGCSGPERSLAPRSTAASVLTLKNLPRVKVAVSPLVRDIGCVIVGQGIGTSMRIAKVPRHLVVAVIGQLDSIEAPVIHGRTGSGSLHVVGGTFRGSGPSQSFLVNCLVPIPFTQQGFTEALAKSVSSGVWDIPMHGLHPYPNDDAVPAVVLASNILLAPIRTGKAPTLGSAVGSRGLGLTGELRARFSTECGLETGIACGQPTLEPVTVTVTARPGWPIVVDLTMLLRSYRMYSMSGLMSVSVYDGPDCSNASELYLTLNEQVERLEADANEVESAIAEVAAQTCESALTDGGAYICIDEFIMSERAAFLVGDNRDFDPYKPYKASRAQLYINPTLCTVHSYVNTSRTIQFGPLGGGTHAPHTLNKVTATLTDSSCVVEWSLLTGWCEGNVPNLLCPAIDGRIELKRDSNGGWTANINEDRYPSRGIYRWTGDHWATVSEREETIWLDLISRRKHIEILRIARDNALQGCEVE
jgi:hypothetical protein